MEKKKLYSSTSKSPIIKTVFDPQKVTFEDHNKSAIKIYSWETFDLNGHKTLVS